MCGRYTLTQSLHAIREAFGVVEGQPNLPPRYNVAPTQTMPVVRLGPGGGRVLAMHRWGLVPHWAKDLSIGARMINARAESVAEKPAFRDSFRQRRCLVPADGFYEWRAVGEGPRPVKQPCWIGFDDRRLFAFAGLWASWHDPEGTRVDSFTIVTTDANPLLRPLHDRMPVILDPDGYEGWLTGDAETAAGLLRTHDPDGMAVFEVGRGVNHVANDDESLLSPAGPEPGPGTQGLLL